MTQALLPGLDEISTVESKLRRFFPPTPLERSQGISTLLGRDVYLKLETALPIRVFKLRGATNKLLSLPDRDIKRGVITASSGNHGLAISFASRLFGAEATVCVPTNVNPQKLAAIREQGAHVEIAGSNYDEAYEHALHLAESRGLTFVHAFNDRDVIAGQGTCGLEISRQLPDLDTAVIGIGGGGLISGVSIALKQALPRCRVYGAETVSIPSMYESVRAGKMVKVTPGKTIADGMQAAIPGDLTFQAVSANVDRIGLVTDDQLEDAIFDLLSLARVLAEPAGASPLAAMKGPLKEEEGKKLVLVISGGNISLDLLATILTKKGKGIRPGPSP